MGAYEQGRLEVERFRVTRAALVGVQVSRDGAMDLHDGEIAENPVGANVQVPDYDFSRLTDRVFYRDNGTNLDSSTLFVPEPTTPPG